MSVRVICDKCSNGIGGDNYLPIETEGLLLHLCPSCVSLLIEWITGEKKIEGLSNKLMSLGRNAK